MQRSYAVCFWVYRGGKSARPGVRRSDSARTPLRCGRTSGAGPARERAPPLAPSHRKAGRCEAERGARTQSSERLSPPPRASGPFARQRRASGTPRAPVNGMRAASSGPQGDTVCASRCRSRAHGTTGFSAQSTTNPGKFPLRHPRRPGALRLGRHRAQYGRARPELTHSVANPASVLPNMVEVVQELVEVGHRSTAIAPICFGLVDFGANSDRNPGQVGPF